MTSDVFRSFFTYHVRQFLPFNFIYFGPFLDPITYPKIEHQLWTFPYLVNNYFFSSGYCYWKDPFSKLIEENRWPSTDNKEVM